MPLVRTTNPAGTDRCHHSPSDDYIQLRAYEYTHVVYTYGLQKVLANTHEHVTYILDGRWTPSLLTTLADMHPSARTKKTNS